MNKKETKRLDFVLIAFIFVFWLLIINVFFNYSWDDRLIEMEIAINFYFLGVLISSLFLSGMIGLIIRGIIIPNKKQVEKKWKP